MNLPPRRINRWRLDSDMRVDIYDRSQGTTELLGSVRLEHGVVQFDEKVEWARKIGVPPPLSPQDGEAYLRALAAVLRRGSYLSAEMVPSEGRLSAVMLPGDEPSTLDDSRVWESGWNKVNDQLVVTFRLPDTPPRNEMETAPNGESGSIARMSEGGVLDVGTSRWKVFALLERKHEPVVDVALLRM